MRVLVVAESLRGGLGSAAVEHVRRLSAQHETALCGPAADAFLAPTEAEFLPLEPLSALASSVRHGVVGRLARLVTDYRPDIVHAHGLRMFLLTRARHSDVWVTLHGAGDEAAASRWRRTGRAGVMAAVPRLATRAFSVFPTGRPGWEFLPHASPVLGDIPDSTGHAGVEFMWVGRLAEPKRPENFVQALALLRGQASGVMYGDGARRGDLQRLISETGAAVRLEGSVADVASRLRDARAVVITSDSEGVPFSMQEAMWGGRPVIVSPLPGTRWLGGDAVDYAHSPAEIAAAMESLLDDDVARSRRTASAAQVRSLITPEAPWDHLFELYEASYGHR